MSFQLVYAPSARKRLDNRILQRNLSMPLKQVLRTVNGKQETYEFRPKACSDGAKQTGMSLIHQFKKYFENLYNKMPDGWYDSSMIPGLPTNSVKLAKLRGVSDRTIRNHIRELKRIGFITNYKFRGTKHDFELFFDPYILFGSVQEAPAIYPDRFSISSTQAPIFSPNNGTNFPLKQPLETKDTEIEINKVENTTEIRRLENGNNASAAQKLPESQAISTINTPDMATGLGAGGGGKHVDKTISYTTFPQYCGQTGFFSRLEPRYQGTVQTFWWYTRSTLYGGRKFSQFEEQAALDAIAEGVFGAFFRQKPEEKTIQKFYKEQLKTVDIAARYYERHQDQWVPAPFAKYIAGTGYFDADNQQGFSIVQLWRAKQVEQYKETYSEQLLFKAILHLKNHAHGRAPKHLQAKTFLELYNYYKVKMQRCGDSYLSKFYRQILLLPQLKQKNAKI